MNIFEELIKERTESLTNEIIDKYGDVNDSPGVYLIRNIKNGKVYVGQTNNLKLRKQNHFADLKANIHHNKHLQSAWNKYGKENFEFEVLEECSLDKLNEVELYWIKYYESYNRRFGYNFELGGNNSPQTQETRDKIDSTIELRKQKIFDEFIMQYLALHNLSWSELFAEISNREKFNIIAKNGGLHFILNCILTDWSKSDICKALQVRSKDIDAYLESFNLNYKEILMKKNSGEYNRVIERFGGKKYIMKNIKLGVAIQDVSDEMRIPISAVYDYIKENNISFEN